MLPPLRGNLDDQHKLVVQIRSAVRAMSYYLWDVLGVGGILAGPCDGVSGSEGNLKVTGSGRWRTCNRLMQNVIPPSPSPSHGTQTEGELYSRPNGSGPESSTAFWGEDIERLFLCGFSEEAGQEKRYTPKYEASFGVAFAALKVEVRSHGS